ncbi:SDR family NAD(P)-dependent oxidoreductase [Nocardia sp. NPDC004415]
MGSLTAKTALVTGADDGIGRAAARRLAAKGALVGVHHHGAAEAAADTVRSIEKDGGTAFLVEADLGAPEGVADVFTGLESALHQAARATLDILVNTADRTVPPGLAPEQVTRAEIDLLFAVNATAPYLLVQRSLALLSDGGRIVNVTSGLTRVANPHEVAYAMSKGALEQITLHFARYLAPRGITVNSVAAGPTRDSRAIYDDPGLVEAMSALSAFNRIGEPGDVADVVAFLATDEARWITGAFIDATGGILLG